MSSALAPPAPNTSDGIRTMEGTSSASSASSARFLVRWKAVVAAASAPSAEIWTTGIPRSAQQMKSAIGPSAWTWANASGDASRKIPAALTTASMPSSCWRHELRFGRRKSRSSRCARRSEHPLASSAAATWRPMKPRAPMTSTLIVGWLTDERRDGPLTSPHGKQESQNTNANHYQRHCPRRNFRSARIGNRAGDRRAQGMRRRGIPLQRAEPMALGPRRTPSSGIHGQAYGCRLPDPSPGIVRLGRAVYTKLGRKHRVAGAAATSAIAAFVDFRLTPARFTPGFEHRLSRKAIAVVYSAFAVGLAMSGGSRHASGRAERSAARLKAHGRSGGGTE